MEHAHDEQHYRHKRVDKTMMALKMSSVINISILLAALVILFFAQPQTKLQGTKILGAKALNLEEYIGRFIEYRAVNKSYPWYERSNKN